MYTTYWWGINDVNSERCGEEFFTELATDSKEAHETYVHDLFPNEKVTCYGKIMESEAEMMGLDTY